MKKQIFTLAIAGLLSSGLYASADEDLNPNKIEKSPNEIAACFIDDWGIIIQSDGTAVVLPDNFVISEEAGLAILEECQTKLKDRYLQHKDHIEYFLKMNNELIGS